MSGDNKVGSAPRYYRGIAVWCFVIAAVLAAGWVSLRFVFKVELSGTLDVALDGAGIGSIISAIFSGLLRVLEHFSQRKGQAEPITATVHTEISDCAGPVQSTGPNTQNVTNGDAVVAQNHSVTHQHGLPASDLADRVIEEARKTGKLEERVEQLETEKQQLQAALDRVQAQADAGDEQAKAAIADARQNGDPEKLQAELIKLADAQGGRITAEMQDYIELCREIAAVAYLRGDVTETEKRLQIILKAFPDDLDATNRMGHIHDFRGQLDEAENCYKKVLAISTDNPIGQAIAYGNLGTIYQTLRDMDKAEEMHRKSLAIEEKLDRQGGMASQYGNLGLIYHARGDLTQAEEMHRKSLAIEEKLGRQEGMASDYGNLGLIYRKRGDLDRAEEMHRKSLAISEELGRREGMAKQYGNLGLVYQTRGDLDKAEEMLRKSLAINKELGRQEGMAIQYGNLGSLYKMRGDLAKARQFWVKSRDLYAKMGIEHMAKKVQGWIDNLPQ